MRTHLVATLGIAISVALGAAAGCGADPEGNGDPTGAASAAISVDAPPIYTVRKDLRRCKAPQCGGWFLQEVNTRDPEFYVSGFDLTRARIGDAQEQALLDAPDREVLVRGVVRPAHHGKLHDLLVTQAYLGMPGFDRADADAFYAVRCVDAGCKEPMVRAANTGIHAPVVAVSVDAALAPRVSGAWLLDRVERHGAIVAGHVTVSGAAVTVTPARTLVASQVFVSLADASGPCARPRHACSGGLTPGYTRDADLCLDFAACVKPVACPLFLPVCAPGYTRVSWPSRTGCPAFACDPSFVGR